MYSEVYGSNSSSSCRDCLPGRYTKDGASCLTCSPNTFSDVKNSRSCQVCDIGYYQYNPGSVKCVECPYFLIFYYPCIQLNYTPVYLASLVLVVYGILYLSRGNPIQNVVPLQSLERMPLLANSVSFNDPPPYDG
jgi:hypothetical protein